MPELFNTNSAAATAPVVDTQTAEKVEVNWDEEVVAEKSDADINEAIPQPPAGRYIVRLSLMDRGDIENPRPGVTKEKKPFITVAMNAEIVDEGSDFNGFTFQVYLTSLVQKIRKTSDVHHLMACVGEILPTTMRLRELRDKVVDVLSNKPLCNVEVEWKGVVKIGSEFVDVARKMTDFPKDPEGDGYKQEGVFEYKGNQYEARAKAYINKYVRS